jgi:hypothetical protein
MGCEVLLLCSPSAGQQCCARHHRSTVPLQLPSASRHWSPRRRARKLTHPQACAETPAANISASYTCPPWRSRASWEAQRVRVGQQQQMAVEMAGTGPFSAAPPPAWLTTSRLACPGCRCCPVHGLQGLGHHPQQLRPGQRVVRVHAQGWRQQQHRGGAGMECVQSAQPGGSSWRPASQLSG